MPEPKPDDRNVTCVVVELEEELPASDAELELVESFLGDLIAELLSEVPEEAN